MPFCQASRRFESRVHGTEFELVEKWIAARQREGWLSSQASPTVLGNGQPCPADAFSGCRFWLLSGQSVLIGDRSAMTVDHLGDRYASPFPQVLASKLVFEDGLASRSLDNFAYGQWRSAATLGNYSSDGCGYDSVTEHWRPYTSDRRRIVDRRKRRKGAPPPSSTAKRRHPSVSLRASSSTPLAVS
jgi:hypothetical protein